MNKTLNSIKELLIESFLMLGLTSLIFAASFIFSQSSHVAVPVNQGARKVLKLIEELLIKSFLVLGLTSLIFAVNFIFLQSSYAAVPVDRGAKEVIQPFELTNPAASRSEAYDDIAKLNNDPKALIAAENKEEQAEEKAYAAAQKAANSAGNQ
jgi:hypothetical protein